MKTLLEQLEAVGACGPAYDWVEASEFQTLEQAWEACDNGFWKLWLAGRVGRLDGTVFSIILKRLQDHLNVAGSYEEEYTALSTQKRRDLARIRMKPKCPFDHVVYAALMVKRGENFPAAFDGVDCSEFLTTQANTLFDPSTLAHDLEDLAEEINPSAPDQDEINSNITLNYEDVTVRHGFRAATEESGVVAYIRGSEVASATTSEGLYKKLRKSFRGYRIFSVTDHGNVTEFDYSGNAVASWV